MAADIPSSPAAASLRTKRDMGRMVQHQRKEERTLILQLIRLTQDFFATAPQPEKKDNGFSPQNIFTLRFI